MGTEGRRGGGVKGGGSYGRGALVDRLGKSGLMGTDEVMILGSIQHNIT